MPAPMWGSPEQRVASMGGFSWSYAELPSPTSAYAVVGSSGAGLGLRILLTPREEDGEISFRVLLGGGSARPPSVVSSGLLPRRVRDRFTSEAWVELWVRHDARGLYLNVSDVPLLAAAPLGGYFAPRSHWSVALGACGVAPPPRGHSGGWRVANLTMRSGARLRYSDELLAITLDGQQLLSGGEPVQLEQPAAGGEHSESPEQSAVGRGANLTFRYFAAARPTVLTPYCGPSGGGTPVTIAAENLAWADATGFECDFRWIHSNAQVLTAGELRRVAPTMSGVSNDTDGAGGAGLVVCPTPESPNAMVGETALGLLVTRGGQRYSTHDDVGGVPLPYTFYPALPNETAWEPRAGPVAGGTLVNFSLPGLGANSPRRFLDGSRCRFTDWYAVGTTAASLAAADTASLCRSPTGAIGSAELHLALNGQDFEPSHQPLHFDFYPPFGLRFAHPRGASPGTAVTVVGYNLDGAGLPRVTHWCRFGDAIVRAVAQPAAIVVDNSRYAHTVRCVVPASAPAGAVRLSVSLNGQQFTAEDLSFSITPTS